MKSKKFHLGDILSITTGRLVSPRHMDGIYDILNFMTQDNLFTHQLPRASEECKPWLLRWFPHLGGSYMDSEIAKLEKILGVATKGEREQVVKGWLAMQVAKFGETFEVKPIPRDDHDYKDPIQELQEKVGADKVIAINLNDENEED